MVIHMILIQCGQERLTEVLMTGPIAKQHRTRCYLEVCTKGNLHRELCMTMFTCKSTHVHVLQGIERKSIRPLDIIILPQVANQCLTTNIVMIQGTSIHLCWLRARFIRLGGQYQFPNDLGRASVSARVN